MRTRSGGRARPSAALTLQGIRGRRSAIAGIAFTREQRAAIHALGEGGALTLLTGVAGAGKTTLLRAVGRRLEGRHALQSEGAGGDRRRDGLAAG